jgi:Na+/proline symporter
MSIAAAVAIVYTTLGGLLADVQTDVIQGVFLIAGLAALALAIPWPDPGTPVPAEALPRSADPPPGSLLGIAELWAIPICGSILAQEAVSRSLAARSAHIARNAAILGGSLYLVIGVIPLAIGAAGPRLLPGLDDPEQILPNLSRLHLAPVLHFVFVAALISAILSTVDSCLLVASSVITRNIVPGAHSAEPSAGRLRLARAATVGGGLVAWLLAAWGDTVHDLVEEASGFGSAGVLVLGIAGLYSRRGGPLAACSSLLAGLAAWIAGRHVWPEAIPHPYLLSLLAAVTAFALGMALERHRRPH